MSSTLVLWTYCPKTTPSDAVRAAHLAYLDGLVASGDLVAAGPREDRPGGVLLFDGAPGDRLDAMLAADPFSGIGLILDTDVIPWRIAIGAPAAAATNG